MDQTYLIRKTMKTTKKQLEAIIRESVKKALEGLDFGDRDWLRSRQDDDAIRQTVMKQPPAGSPGFGQLVQAANAAFRKIQAKGDQAKTTAALSLKREVEQLAQAPQSGANVMRARMLTGKLVALSK